MENTISASESSKAAEGKLATSIAFIFVSSAYLIVLSIIPGLSDWLLLIFFSTTVLTMFYQVYRIRSGFRSISKGVFSESSLAYKFLNGKSIWQRVLSIIFACFSSIAFLLTLKLVVLNYGYPLGLLIILSPLFILTLLDGKDFSLSVEKMMRYDDAKDVVNFVINVFIRIVLVTIIISLFLSAADTFTFHDSKVTVTNYFDHAMEHSVPLGEGGHKARSLINIFVVAGSFKSAAANEVFSLLKVEKNIGAMTSYFFITLILNLMKVFPFSVAYVFINLSLQDRVAKGLVKGAYKAMSRFNIINNAIKKDGVEK